jgi:hypothetical protein
MPPSPQLGDIHHAGRRTARQWSCVLLALRDVSQNPTESIDPTCLRASHLRRNLPNGYKQAFSRLDNLRSFRNADKSAVHLQATPTCHASACGNDTDHSHRRILRHSIIARLLA